MPRTTAEGIEIYYEVAGAPADPVIVLLSGGGAQLIGWPDDLVALLTERGFRVVRLDNRDTGLSQHFGGEADLDGGYDVSDMADDVLRVLDDLGASAAHVVGHSMGGIIAQMMAIEHPDRVLSLGLLSTLPGHDPRHVLHSTDPAVLLASPPRFTREQAIELAVQYAAFDGQGLYDPQLQWHAEAAATAYDRDYAPEGAVRQWAALLRAPERLERLRELSHPAFVFHGREDGTLHWSAAVDIAAALSGAELQVRPRVGHLIPLELWPELVEGIVRTAARA